MTDFNLDLSAVKGHVVIIPAAGVGHRFGSDKPKQYQLLSEKMILDTTLDIFLSSDKVEKVLLVISPDDQYFRELQLINNEKIIIVDGGEQRQLSVNNGLRYLYDNGLPDNTPLLVHDAVRPCLSSSDLNKLLDFYSKNNTACFLAQKISDSVKKVDHNNAVRSSVERDDLILAQTPQMASFIQLKNAFSSIIKAGISITDEVSALTSCDVPVVAVISDNANFKITEKKDLLLAEQIMKSRK